MKEDEWSACDGEAIENFRLRPDKSEREGERRRLQTEGAAQKDEKEPNSDGEVTKSCVVSCSEGKQEGGRRGFFLDS